MVYDTTVPHINLVLSLVCNEVQVGQYRRACWGDAREAPYVDFHVDHI